jgi:hypothetical protein
MWQTRRPQTQTNILSKHRLSPPPPLNTNNHARFPYQVGINVYKKVGVNPPTFFGFCGGSLIRDDVVLTAAQ